MRILAIGPNYPNGSVPPYMKLLTDAFNNLNCKAHWIGSTQVPYDQKKQVFWNKDEVFACMDKLLKTVNLNDYDIISLNYGNLEMEQVIPLLLKNTSHPPIVYHVHTLDPTLFVTHIIDAETKKEIDNNFYNFDGHIFFGDYARQHKAKLKAPTVPNDVVWLPSTIAKEEKYPSYDAIVQALDSPLPIISMYGFASPWKEMSVLVSALEKATQPLRFILAGPFWDDPEQVGMDLNFAKHKVAQIGNCEMIVIPEYVGSQERELLAKRSIYGVFPYKFHHSFQGSGAVGDYLFVGTPVIATKTGNMSELIGAAGMLISPDSPALLAQALDDALSSDTSDGLAKLADERSYKFSGAYHAENCMSLYKEVLRK